MATPSFSGVSDSRINAAAITPDGKFMAAGRAVPQAEPLNPRTLEPDPDFVIPCRLLCRFL
ncbi:MAG: hypothetical protein ACHRHE_11645 [Tepidisphaerales bacterium]